MDVNRLQKLAGAVRTGGKGSVRRKKKVAHKTTSTDDKRLQSVLKRLGVTTVPGIDEVNIFCNDTVTHFTSPKVQAATPANTYVISGQSQTKKLQDLLPSIASQLGPESFQTLKKMAAEFNSNEA
ncbi:unnamed protein product [Bathycoccus prasinos]|jgi:nascent polypeptide-associated complex subunit beta